MARSAIIKDLANSAVDTMTALKRAKVLFAELGNDDLLKWVSYEIAGYPDNVDLPDYREVSGYLIGSYIKGSMAAHMKWTNVSLPLGEEYTYTGEKNLEETIQALFLEPFGGGYPESEAKRKIEDAKKLKEIKSKSQIDFEMFLNELDSDMVKKVKHRILTQ